MDVSSIWIYRDNAKSDAESCYIELCKESISRNEGDWTLIESSQQNIRDYLRRSRDEYELILEVAHRTDHVRAAVLAECASLRMDEGLVQSGVWASRDVEGSLGVAPCGG